MLKLDEEDYEALGFGPRVWDDQADVLWTPDMRVDRVQEQAEKDRRSEARVTGKALRKLRLGMKLSPAQLKRMALYAGTQSAV